MHEGDKASKDEADYRRGTATRFCLRCAMYRHDGSCESVKGDISPMALCDYFEELDGEVKRH
jgi:hypothetical protein